MKPLFAQVASRGHYYKLLTDDVARKFNNAVLSVWEPDYAHSDHDHLLMDTCHNLEYLQRLIIIKLKHSKSIYKAVDVITTLDEDINDILVELDNYMLEEIEKSMEEEHGFEASLDEEIMMPPAQQDLDLEVPPF